MKGPQLRSLRPFHVKRSSLRVLCFFRFFRSGGRRCRDDVLPLLETPEHDQGHDVRDAVDAVLSGDASRITYNHIKVSRAVLAMMNTLVLLGEGDDEDFDSSAFIESILEILCDNKTPEYSGWTVSTKIDQSADTLTITVSSK